jgi:hypothetical protein
MINPMSWGNQMCNVYIKSFNRPFYLDRCIRSIRFNVRNYQKIIVLDDGTETKYIARLKDLHPEVEFRTSGADDGKMALLRQLEFKKIDSRYPSATAFWVSEVVKDPSKYVLIMEDDAWFSRKVDLKAIIASLDLNHGVICKLWWGTAEHVLSKRHHLGGGSALDYFDPKPITMSTVELIWIVAFALFNKDYWLHCVRKAKRLGDENSQLLAAISYSDRFPNGTFCRSVERSVYQGWVIPGRSTPEYYDKGLKQHKYMDALNEEWHSGNLRPSEGFPFDFPDIRISGILEKHLTQAEVQVWHEWKARDIKYLYND